MQLNKEQINEILVSKGYISEADLKQAEASKDMTPMEFLFDNGLLTKDLLGQAIAENYELSYSDLNSKVPSTEQVFKIPKEIAIKYRIVYFAELEDRIVLATDDPEKAFATPVESEFLQGKEAEITYSLTEDINYVLRFYDQKENNFQNSFESGQKLAPALLADIFEDAAHKNASDIHMEPLKEEVLIRYRIDGVLNEIARISFDTYAPLLNRIKILTKVRIDQHQKVQEGAIRHEGKDLELDLRVSVTPTINGEKTVMRLLPKYLRGLSLAEIGLNEKQQQSLEKASHKPYGMILVVGPTGSGKTTTLYSILKLINKPGVNITTIEDPVEYKIEFINQIQVNKDMDITFAKGLRAIVRQDPDVILVGEVRDLETAEIAVNASLAGHLLLSTFHANDAATAIPRLIDMGIEPFLLASTMDIIVAQRLIRKTCESCKTSREYEPEELNNYIDNADKYFGKKKHRLYYGKGCEACQGSGYYGRSALFEFIEITTELKELIVRNPTSREIWEQAVKDGSRSLFEDGIDKVMQGITSIEELQRVAVNN